MKGNQIKLLKMKLSTYTLLISATAAIRMEMDPATETTEEKTEALECQFILVSPEEGAICKLLVEAAEGEEDPCNKLKSKEDCEKGMAAEGEQVVGGDEVPEGETTDEKVDEEIKEGEEPLDIDPEQKLNSDGSFCFGICW